MKKWLGIFVVAAFGAATGAGVMRYMGPTVVQAQPENSPFVKPTLHVVNPGLATSTGANVVENPDFVNASAIATPAVVHIKSYFEQDETNDPFGGFFGNPFGDGMAQAAGSGVIISQDGYIATNNHVVKKADKVEVVLEDKRTYTAKIIGTDPTTDLALLKIEENNLNFLPFGNSEKVQIGEWVLAVGNPFNLTSTVTAGIVSAKGRSLNLLREEFAIESFIQTDAAVNPGNSGGALINTKGELVGINTAIASETGSYAGYSFAIPVNIVRKVMSDLKEFGEVQKGIIGVQIRNIDHEFAEEMDLNTLKGAYVNGTISGGAAEAAGIERGDIITRVNETEIGSAAELQEAIGTFRPGDKVMLRIIRNKKEMPLEVILRNKNGNTSLGKTLGEKEEEIEKIVAEIDLGGTVEELGMEEKRELGIRNGVKVTNIYGGKLKEAGIEKGFVITRVNKHYVNSEEDIKRIVTENDGSILIEGITRSGKHKFYALE